jgi:hypothetical protein
MHNDVDQQGPPDMSMTYTQKNVDKFHKILYSRSRTLSVICFIFSFKNGNVLTRKFIGND